MNLLTKSALGVALSGVLAFPALAGGLGETVVEVPVVVPAPPIVVGTDWTGGYVGAQIGYGDVSATGGDGDGFTIGVHGGYDWDFGNWVLGAGVDYDWDDIDLGSGSDSLDYIARLKLRAGADVGRALLYATGGAAFAGADISGSSYSDTGWFAGVGADYLITDQWTVGGEILTNQFDEFDNSGVDVDATTVSVNVGFRF